MGVPEGMPNLENSMDERYGSRSGRYNLWPWHERNTNRWNDALFSCYATSSDGSSSEIVLTQHNFCQGLKLVGKVGENAVTTELKQLHSHQVLEPKSMLMNLSRRRDLMHCNTSCF